MLSESDLCHTSSLGIRHSRNIDIFVPVGWPTASSGYQVSTNLDKTTELPKPGSVVLTGMVPPSVGEGTEWGHHNSATEWRRLTKNQFPVTVPSGPTRLCAECLGRLGCKGTHELGEKHLWSDGIGND